MKKGYIHVYTGNGGGKTTAALGVAMRALGHGHRVDVVQFMKGRKDIGEWKFQKNLKEKTSAKFAMYQFGRKEFVNLKKPSVQDEELANQGLGFAEALMNEKNPPKLIVLDELNLAAAVGLVDVAEVVKMLKRVPKGIDVYITGRRAPAEFLKIADFVTVVEDKKRKNVAARKGIDY
ncbi:cob(I)yrinic acid a,c-diamide adenosyltransferase [Candidatus Woesearchaeota archaeon]|nr:cob(I)yrinic acid a,c-diamide adenosyltransferase [Candidatus Woesearchaeota archaeon]